MADHSKTPGVSLADLARAKEAEGWADQMARTARAIKIARDEWSDLLGVPCVVEQDGDTITIHAHRPATANGASARRTNGATARADE